jgi:hypothetical protein
MAVQVMSRQVANRRRTATAIRAAHPGALVIDVSPKGTGLWTRLSPYYPHGGIPVPLSPGAVAQSVEGVWQALKVFARDDVDRRKLLVTDVKGLKRTVRRNGAVLGYRAGLDGDALLDHEQARRRIYLPAYRWTLENAAADLVAKLAQLGHVRNIILLDDNTNCDITDARAPLSHAALVRLFLEDDWPDETASAEEETFANELPDLGGSPVTSHR